jgi:hypothetical protein
MAEPLWTILQNKAANVGDHESNTMQDSDTIMQQEGVKLLTLPQPQLRARTDAHTNPSAQRATQLMSVLARVCSVSRQNLNTTTVP